MIISEIGTITTAISHIYMKISREDSVISLLNSYLGLNFDVLHAATGNRQVDIHDIRLVKLGPIALFNQYKLTASSRKHLENISHAHVVPFMYKLITSAKDSDDLSIGLDRERNSGQRELTTNKIQKGKFHVRNYLKDIFGFAECQEKGTFELGYKLTLKRKTDNSVLSKANATIVGKIKIIAIESYMPHYTHSIPQQVMLSKHFLSKVPTELQYEKRSAFTKKVITQKLWIFELGTQEGINVPIYIFVGFQQRVRQDSQNYNNDTYYRPSVTIVQCIIGTENYPDSETLLNYDNDNYSQGYG